MTDEKAEDRPLTFIRRLFRHRDPAVSPKNTLVTARFYAGLPYGGRRLAMTDEKAAPGATARSGPLFEASRNADFLSVHGASGGHYNVFKVLRGIESLKKIFPTGEADEMQFVLFGTSGVHGSYASIEDIEANLLKENGQYDLTFLVVQPRLVTLRYGVATVTLDDLPYLKALRKSSRKVMRQLG